MSSFLGSICRKSKSFDSRCRVERLGGRIQYYVIDAENDKVGNNYWSGINILEFSISRNVYWETELREQVSNSRGFHQINNGLSKDMETTRRK